MPDAMWAGINKVAGRIAFNTGERTTASDVIRMACAGMIEAELKLTEAETPNVVDK